jgi:uncharacterized protein
MLRTLKTGLLVAGTAAMIAVPVAASAQNIKIGAMRLGTSWYVFGATLAKLLQPQFKGATVEVIARGGGVGNPIAVNSGKAQIALANVATANWAWNGHPVVYKGKKYRNIRSLVGGLNSVWVTAMLREEYIKRTGNDTLEKALLARTNAPRIVMKPAGSSVPVVADMIMAAVGSSRAMIKKNGGDIIQVGAKQIPSLVRDGRADLYFETALRGHPAVTEVSLTGNVRFLDLPDKVLANLAKQGLKPKPLPKWFKGQSGPTKAVDLGTLIIANAAMPDDVAYKITKTIVENKAAMARAHKAWSNFVPEEAWKPENSGIPLHPGAIKYYKERGWM